MLTMEQSELSSRLVEEVAKLGERSNSSFRFTTGTSST